MSHETEAPPEDVLRRMLQAVVLPKAVSAFEASYLQRMNRIALLFFYAHLPAFLLIAWANDTDPLFTAVLISTPCRGSCWPGVSPI